MSTRKLTDAERKAQEEYEEMAHEIESHMGDVSTWSKKPLFSGENMNVGNIYSMPITIEQLNTLHDAAEADGVSMDTFILNAALDAAKARSKRARASTPRKD